MWVLAGKSHRAYWAGIVAQITAVIVLLVLGVIRNISRVRERDKINMVWCIKLNDLRQRVQFSLFLLL